MQAPPALKTGAPLKAKTEIKNICGGNKFKQMTVGGQAGDGSTLLDTFIHNDSYFNRMIPRRPQRHSTAPKDKRRKTIDTAVVALRWDHTVDAIQKNY